MSRGRNPTLLGCGRLWAELPGGEAYQCDVVQLARQVFKALLGHLCRPHGVFQLVLCLSAPLLFRLEALLQLSLQLLLTTGSGEPPLWCL